MPRDGFTCDMLVIGGGAAGLLTASEAERRGLTVAVAEKHGFGGGRTASLYGTTVSGGAGSPESLKRRQEAQNALISLANEVRCPLRRCPLFLYTDRERGRYDVEREFHTQKYSRGGSEYLSSRMIANSFSFSGLCGAYTDDAAAVTDVNLFAARLADRLSLRGVVAEKNTEITEVSVTKEGFAVKTGAGAIISAKSVVDCRAHKVGICYIRTLYTPPVSTLDGWRDGCVICDPLNRMLFGVDNGGRLLMTYTSKSPFDDAAFMYMQSVLSSMFVAIPETSVAERRVYRTGSHCRISCVDGAGKYFRFENPYTEGLLSAQLAVSDFFENTDINENASFSRYSAS